MASFSLTNNILRTTLEIDPDGVYAWLILHHLIQLGLTVLVMAFLFDLPLSTWGFNLSNWKKSLLIVIAFAVLFSLIQYAYVSGTTYSPGFPLTPANKIGWQVFQYFFSGLGEEPLFRAFVIVLLLCGLSSTTLPANWQNALAVGISTLAFMFAHLSVDWVSFSIIGFDFDQQMMALQLGVLYGVTFVYTRSLLAPIMLHGLSNGITSSLGMYLSP